MAGRRWVGGWICVGLMTSGCGLIDGSDCDEVFFVGSEGDRLIPSYDVYAYDEHGEQTKRLTDDHASIDAAVSPDGKRMVVRSWRGSSYDAELGPATVSLYVSDIDGDDEQRLTSGHSDDYPAWSPDGTKIAFVRGGNISKILVLDLAHPSTTTLVATIPQYLDSPIIWLDNETVAWWSHRPRAVLSRDASGTGPISVAIRDVPARPVWSPDGTKIAYSKVATRSRATGPDLYELVVRDLDSGRVTPVADSASGDTGPLGWTKDDRLFFTRNIAGEGVHIKTVEGGAEPSTVVGILGEVSVTMNPACG
jgi:Tol biopolymer transport system component